MSETTPSVVKKCKHCQSSIDAKAKKCQHCGSDLRNWFVRHPVWTIILLLIFLPPFIGGLRSSWSVWSTNTYSASSTVVESQKSVTFFKSLTVISSKIVEDTIASPAWYVTVKNTSTKTIDAYTIAADLYNNFDEPVEGPDSFGARNNTVSAMSQYTLKPGDSEDHNFTLAGYDSVTKIKNVRITKIHFTDGSMAGN